MRHPTKTIPELV